ncbi:MAG: SAVED domain-containing protein [Anaerolineales bacterium]|nr:SAVED domain-containing protein [Anaerolineales bacterium]
MKSLFISYYSGDEKEVIELSSLLKLRGIKVWRDQEKGLLSGDATQQKIKEFIEGHCFGFLFYATPKALSRDFIKKIEITEAIREYENNSFFRLITILRDLSFNELTAFSLKEFGLNFSNFFALSINEPFANSSQECVSVAQSILDKICQDETESIKELTPLKIQYCTREKIKDQPDSDFVIDATHLTDIQFNSDAWELVSDGLKDIKKSISRYYGRPRLEFSGSNYLTGSFLLGHIFSAPSGFKSNIRTKYNFWSTECKPLSDSGFIQRVETGNIKSTDLFVEITATEKPVQSAVRRYISKIGKEPFRRVQFSPKDGPIIGAIQDNSVCTALAFQIRESITEIIETYNIEKIHIFGSIPQAFAFILGHNLNATRPIQLYEYDGCNYHPSYCVK